MWQQRSCTAAQMWKNPWLCSFWGHGQGSEGETDEAASKRRRPDIDGPTGPEINVKAEKLSGIRTLAGVSVSQARLRLQWGVFLCRETPPHQHDGSVHVPVHTRMFETQQHHGTISLL